MQGPLLPGWSPAPEIAMSLLFSIMGVSPSTYTSNEGRRNRQGCVFLSGGAQVSLRFELFRLAIAFWADRRQLGTCRAPKFSLTSFTPPVQLSLHKILFRFPD